MKEFAINLVVALPFIGVVWFLIHVWIRERRIAKQAEAEIAKMREFDWDALRKEMERKYEARVQKEIQAIRDGKII